MTNPSQDIWLSRWVNLQTHLTLLFLHVSKGTAVTAKFLSWSECHPYESRCFPKPALGRLDPAHMLYRGHFWNVRSGTTEHVRAAHCCVSDTIHLCYWPHLPGRGRTDRGQDKLYILGARWQKKHSIIPCCSCTSPPSLFQEGLFCIQHQFIQK